LLTGLAGVAAPAMAGVVPGSTFDIDIAAFNSTGTTGYYVFGTNGPETATFGSTDVFTGAGIDGQTITVSSSESVGATTTTDTIIVSTPTNFLTTNKIDGTTMTSLQLDLGDADADNVGISLNSPVASSTASGYMLYGSGETQFTLTPGNDSTSTTLAAAEGVSTSGAIASVGVNEFELTFTYANPAPVPEPASFAVFGAGLLGLLTVAQRRRLTR